eukprot:Sspe_Gene.49648::Locus_26949_Transcript_1_1_Confidence_1.000_Length_640::g.49648::m.49648
MRDSAGGLHDVHTNAVCEGDESEGLCCGTCRECMLCDEGATCSITLEEDGLCCGTCRRPPPPGSCTPCETNEACDGEEVEGSCCGRCIPRPPPPTPCTQCG